MIMFSFRKLALIAIAALLVALALPNTLFAQETEPIDSDGDGITDTVDACPELFGLIDFNGCPESGAAPDAALQIDTDGDGLLDYVDDCPNEFGTLPERGCALVLPANTFSDTDGDGLVDGSDSCPTTYALTADGCPPVGQGGGATTSGFSDSDGDGLVDNSDVCPFQFALTSSGCLDAGQGGGQPPVVEPGPIPAPESGCPGSMPPRLEVGDEGQIVSVFSTLRNAPDGTPIQRIYSPDTFVVLEGPVCFRSLTYYRIDYGDGLVGWALESQRSSIYGDNRYWLEPR